MEMPAFRKFSAEDDALILSWFHRYENNPQFALEKLQIIFEDKHSRRAIQERYRSFLSRNPEPFTEEEDKFILNARKNVNNKWSNIAKSLPTNRSGEQVKIRFFQLLKKKQTNYQLEPSNAETNQSDLGVAEQYDTCKFMIPSDSGETNVIAEFQIPGIFEINFFSDI